MEESALSPYLGCAIVARDQARRVLLVRETKAIARGRLSLPGGGVEVDESIAQAAIRETEEETGLEVELDGLLGIFHCWRTSESTYGVSFVFAAEVVGGEPTPTAEHPELVWLSIDELEAHQSAGQIRGMQTIEAVRRADADFRLPDGIVTRVVASDADLRNG